MLGIYKRTIGTLVDNLPKIGMCLNCYCIQCINPILINYIWIKSTTHEIFNDTNFVQNGYVYTQPWLLEKCKKAACFRKITKM